VAFAVGDPPTATLLRRAVSLYATEPSSGRIEVVVAAHGPGTEWLTRRRPGDVVDVVGPLGVPYRQPAGRRAVVVGGGYGSAPLLWWATELRAAGVSVEAVLGAGSKERLFGVEAAYRILGDPRRVHVTTEDGGRGVRGRVTDVLPALLGDGGSGGADGADVPEVYACGPMGMLRAVAEQATAAGVPSYVAVEESMACGVGVCMTCVLPVVGEDGQTRLSRSCTEGPVFGGDRVRFDDVGTLTWDVVGADAMGVTRP
jgi:dihydroorotate dehydrogenase electron transfer subunit